MGTVTQLLNSISKLSDRQAHVVLSNELVTLLSEQLYQSPLKAIEELIVNSYDANARECRLFVPASSDADRSAIMVWDDGEGMDSEGLIRLWRVGHSAKRHSASTPRKAIGKFGIGKLAANAIGNRLTYISKKSGKIYSTSVNFRDFKQNDSADMLNIPVPLHEISSVDEMFNIDELSELFKRAGVDRARLDAPNWTVVLVEELKEKSREIRLGRLNWVISTALPLVTDFAVSLNGTPVQSSKENEDVIIEFSSRQVNSEELKGLAIATGYKDWKAENGLIVCPIFPSGIKWESRITKNSLYGRKSEDIGRSHGFFVRVRGRVISLSDPEFGIPPRSFDVFNRFAADVHVDDLHDLVAANREEIRDSIEKKTLQSVLNWILTRARSRYIKELEEIEKIQKSKTEQKRVFIAPKLIEFPLADALSVNSRVGAEADSSWFYINKAIDPKGAIRKLTSDGHRTYSYRYEPLGRTARIVRLDIESMVFTINEDHQFVKEHAGSGAPQRLLEDFATAEALLEVYLHRHGVSAEIIGEVLEARDSLLRSLAAERKYSLKSIAQFLRDSASDEKDLEIGLVSAARALGFMAKQISGAGEPDGLARFMQYPGGEALITLEAKSTGATAPALSAIDFAGLESHRLSHNANGCLLVCPSYPGATRGTDSEVFIRAKACGVSCWTIDQLARVVESAEIRHITATKIVAVVTNSFTPEEVSLAVDKLLSEPVTPDANVCRKIIEVLQAHSARAIDRPRSVALITGWVTSDPAFENVTHEQVCDALSLMASASRGAMIMTNDTVLIHTAVSELERRLESVIGGTGRPRKLSVRREDIQE